MPSHVIPRTILSCLLLQVFSAAPSMAHEIECDAGFVALDDGVIEVFPTGVDDTDNIQCALDEARRISAPVVQLQKGQFYISHIQIADFQGSLEGRSIAATVVEVMDQSVDCTGLLEAGQVPSAVKFINGKAQLRTMTLNVGSPCATEHTRFFVVHFTGEDALSGCDPGTGHGVVDRVVLNLVEPQEGEPEFIWAAVAAQAEGYEYVEFRGEGIESCRNRQFGTFKLNRSTIAGPFYQGVVLSLRASALVDIAFNEFVGGQLVAVSLRDAGQVTSIQNNDFILQGDASAINVLQFPEDYQPPIPNRNRVVIHQNSFTTGDPSGELWSLGGMDLRNYGQIQFSAVVTENTFNLVERNIAGIHAFQVEGLIVANNVFKGTARMGVGIYSGDLDVLASTSITGNAFGALDTLVLFPGDADIILGERVVDSVIGPGQQATITDDGTGNLVGEQF